MEVSDVFKRKLSPRETLDAIDEMESKTLSPLLADQFKRLLELRKENPSGDISFKGRKDNKADLGTDAEAEHDDSAKDRLGKSGSEGGGGKVQAWRYSNRSRRDRPSYPNPYAPRGDRASTSE